jgi:cytochrome c peroxidase
MAFYQLGEQLADKDINDIVAFLESLTGVYSE